MLMAAHNSRCCDCIQHHTFVSVLPNRSGGPCGKGRFRGSPMAVLEQHVVRPSIPSSLRSGRRLRNVAILVGVSGSYGRGLLNGIAQFNREVANWSICFHPQGAMTSIPDWFASWRGDGAVVMTYNPEMTRQIAEMNVPVVNVRLCDHETPFPYVGLDHWKIGQMAAENLLSLGLQNFAFCGREAGMNPGLDVRGQAFRERIEAAGKRCDVYAGAGPEGWEEEQDRLAQWAMSLPKPVGVMASNDERGLHLLDVCRRCGLAVPDDVAVIGVDNDEDLCELTIPPLSSVDLESERVGYAAAQLLEAMMSDEDLQPPMVTQLAPRRVVTRHSSDVVASDDVEINRAVAFIRANVLSGRRVTIADIVGHVGLSRVTLQSRIKSVLGRTLHEEIEYLRLTRVKSLLLCRDMSIKQIAVASGFSSVQYMTRVFHRWAGETPAKYRKRCFAEADAVPSNSEKN